MFAHIFSKFLWVFIFGSTENSKLGSVIENLTLHAQVMPSAAVAAPAMVQTNTYATSAYSPPKYNASQTTLQQQQSIKRTSYVSNSNQSAPDGENTVVVSPNAEYPLDVVALHSCRYRQSAAGLAAVGAHEEKKIAKWIACHLHISRFFYSHHD